jgi:elongation factor Tu
MGFWGKLFGRAEYDTTVTEFQATGPSRPFRLDIEDVFFITGRGTVATGTVGAGILSVGDAVEVVRADGTRQSATVTGIEAFRKIQKSAGVGDMIGVLLDSVTRDDLKRGDTLVA